MGFAFSKLWTGLFAAEDNFKVSRDSNVACPVVARHSSHIYVIDANNAAGERVDYHCRAQQRGQDYDFV